jgi:hypothetical protein
MEPSIAGKEESLAAQDSFGFEIEGRQEFERKNGTDLS